MRLEEVRQIVNLGNSKIVTLPPWWIRLNGLVKGDKVSMCSEDGELVLRKVEKVEPK